MSKKQTHNPDVEEETMSVINHLKAALAESDDEAVQHHLRHALLYLGGQ